MNSVNIIGRLTKVHTKRKSSNEIDSSGQQKLQQG